MRFQMTRDFYIPSNEPTLKTVTREGVDAVAYTYETKNGKPLAIAFRGKAQKPSFHYSFTSTERRTATIEEFFRGVTSHAERKEQRSKERKAFKHSLKAGDILRTSWGYDQTNVNFYQIISVTTKSAKVREIGGETVDGIQTAAMSCYVRAVRDAFIKNAPVLTVRITEGNCATIDDHHASTTTTNEKHYCSWYA